jgi:hypothetical protein
MNSGTYQLSLEASAARPDVARGSRLADLDGVFAGSYVSATPACATSAIHAIPAGQTWLQMWNAKPAFPVAHTDRHSPRPLERSP